MTIGGCVCGSCRSCRPDPGYTLGTEAQALIDWAKRERMIGAREERERIIKLLEHSLWDSAEAGIAMYIHGFGNTATVSSLLALIKGEEQ